MNKFNEIRRQQNYNIIVVDDEKEILDSLSTVLRESGYKFTGVTNPAEAIELIKNGHFDLLLLDFLMPSCCGDKVVEEIRKFDKELYILLLAGQNDINSPLEVIKNIDIQGYCEKEDNFDQLLLLIESGIKSIKQMREINGKLAKAKSKLEKAYLESIETLRDTVEAKDQYTRGHSDRVSELAVLVGKKMELSREELKTLKIGALFHDIGKIGIPDSILLKKSKLSNDEYSKIKQHPLIGAHILSNATIFKDIVPIVKYHHERFDGKGYPENLIGEKIPVMARITAVVDAFDAMSSRHTYRESWDLDEIVEEIRKNKGTQFDPVIADVFLEILENEIEKVREIQEKY